MTDNTEKKKASENDNTSLPPNPEKKVEGWAAFVNLIDNIVRLADDLGKIKKG